MVCDRHVRLSHINICFKKTKTPFTYVLCVSVCVCFYKIASDCNFVSMGKIRNVSYRMYRQVTNANLSSGETGQKVSPSLRGLR